MKRYSRRALPLAMGLLLFPLGCVTDPFASPLLQPSDLCSDYPDDARPTFEDLTVGNMVYVMAGSEVDNTHPLTCVIVSALFAQAMQKTVR